MSGVEELTARLGELQAERAALQSARTRDDAVRAAKEYADVVRRRHAELGGFVLGGAIMGDPLQSVLTAFIATRPEFEEWLEAQARTVCGELSDRQKQQKIAKLDGAIAKVTDDLRVAEEAVAVAEVKARFEREAASRRSPELDLAQIAEREFAGSPEAA